MLLENFTSIPADGSSAAWYNLRAASGDAGESAARLQDQLVEGAARFYEFSVLRQNLLVRDEDVGSLPQGMLTARYAMHGKVEQLANSDTRS